MCINSILLYKEMVNIIKTFMILKLINSKMKQNPLILGKFAHLKRVRK